MNITNPKQLIIGILAVIGLLCVLSKLDFLIIPALIIVAIIIIFNVIKNQKYKIIKSILIYNKRVIFHHPYN